MCDFGTAAWPQMMQTPTKKVFKSCVYSKKIIPCYIGSNNSRVLEGKKDLFVFSFCCCYKGEEKRWGMGKQKVRRGKNKKRKK